MIKDIDDSIKGTILVTGSNGRIGSAAASKLAHSSLVDRLILTDHPTQLQRGEALRDTLRVSAAMVSAPKTIEFIPLNLYDPDNTLQLFENQRPDVILHTASLMSFYYYLERLEQRLSEIGLNHHYPAHSIPKDLALTYELMKAVSRAKISTDVVNVCFPDFVNYILSQRSLNPTVGAGNMDIFVYMMRWILAQQNNQSIDRVQIDFVAHHALEYFGSTAPFYLRAYIDGRDVTSDIDPRQLLLESIQTLSEPQWLGGHDLITETTTTSAVKNALILLSKQEQVEYVPGGAGLLGGCMTQLKPQEVWAQIPKGITLPEVQAINQAHAELDGVKQITTSGDVIFTEDTRKLCEEVLGLNWKGFSLDKVTSSAKELQQAYKQL
jgi:hypothetical protein